MTVEQSTLQKVMTALGLADAQTEVATEQVEAPAVELAEPEVPAEAPAEEAPVEEAPAKSVEELIAGLDEKISMIAEAVAKLVADEVAEPVEEAPAVPPVPAAPLMSKQDLSAVKPFNGAPKEGPAKINAEAKNNGTTLDAVFAKLYS